jgi:hypothetical protein
MNDKDSKNIELLYEDLAGNTMPQYGSNAPIVVAPIGTETLRSGTVEIPNVPEEEMEKDNEELENISPIAKVLEDLKNTIQKYEQKKKERMTKRINDVINQESVNIQEGILGGILAGAGTLAKGIKQGSSTAFDPIRAGVDLIRKSESEEPDAAKTVGYKDKQSKPIIDKYVIKSDSSDVVGKVIAVNKPSNRFTVELQGNYFFAKNKNGKVGYVILNVTNENRPKIDLKYTLQKTLEVGQDTQFPSWFHYKGNAATIGAGTSTTPTPTRTSTPRQSALSGDVKIKPIRGSTYQGMDPTGTKRVIYTYNTKDGWTYQTRGGTNILNDADQQILTKKWRKQWQKYLDSGTPTNATYGPPKASAPSQRRKSNRGTITPNPNAARVQ